MSHLTKAILLAVSCLVGCAMPLFSGDLLGALDRLCIALMATGAVSYLAEERDELRRKAGVLK